MPKISIIIPVYNVEKYLRRCLDSVVNQTFSDWEAICVNDGSPDNSNKILAEYASRDKRFKVINKKNGGLSDARNTGLKKARGKYVLYLDSDDFIHPQALEILNFFANKNDAEMVAFDIDMHAKKEMQKMVDVGQSVCCFLPSAYNKRYDIKKIKNKVTDEILFYSTERNDRFGKFIVRHCYPVLKMLDRKLANHNKFIKNIIMEDFPWWSAVMLSHPRTVIVNMPLYFYTPNVSSILHTSKELRIITSIFYGLNFVHKLYKSNATADEMAYYNRNFLWPFVIIAYRKIRCLTNSKDLKEVRTGLSTLYKKGIFDNPPTMRARKYKRRIEKFISQI